MMVGCGGSNTRPAPTAFDSGPETTKAGPLGRGINMGNMLEAPREGDWGQVIQPSDFVLIKEKGFDTVRIPIRWSAHAETEAPFTIDPDFFTRVDEVFYWAQAQNLNVILNNHHWTPEEALFTYPDANRDRFIAIWKQVATHFRLAPESLFLELLNEPHGNLDASAWNDLLADTIKAIRAVDARHMLIVGGANWNSAYGLEDLRIPSGEKKILATFHFYSPFKFTHQGAEWTNPIPPVGTPWPGAELTAACEAIRSELQVAKDWSEANGIPVFMGEFGAYGKGDMISRANWTAYVRKQAETLGFSWAYWEYCAGFGLYDLDRQSWRPELTDALGLKP